VPIISRNNCVYVTLGTCYSVWMTVWYVGAYAPSYQTFIHKITRTKCHTNTVVSTDDGHIVAETSKD